jgi:hypothetical protein
MGDTGSLALGGLLGSIAVATKHELQLAIVGGLFVLEAVSVIVQVISFKLTGKRVFRMRHCTIISNRRADRAADRDPVLDHLDRAALVGLDLSCDDPGHGIRGKRSRCSASLPGSRARARCSQAARCRGVDDTEDSVTRANAAVRPPICVASTGPHRR